MAKRKQCSSIAATYGQRCQLKSDHKGAHKAGPVNWVLDKSAKKQPRGLYEVAVPDLNTGLLTKRTRAELIQLLCNVGSVANEYTPIGVGNIGDRALAKLNLLKDGLDIRKKDHAKFGYTGQDSLPVERILKIIADFKLWLQQRTSDEKEALWKWLDEEPEAIDQMIECVAPEELDAPDKKGPKETPADKREFLLSCTKQLKDELGWRVDELEQKIRGER